MPRSWIKSWRWMAAMGLLAVGVAGGLARGGEPGCVTGGPAAAECDGVVASAWTVDEGETVFDRALVPQEQNAWFSAEYLMWWLQPGETPPLVTSGPASDPMSGALGQPGTQTLFGGSLDSLRHGGRFTAGTWLNQDHTLGLEASYFFLGGGGQSYTGTASNDPNAPLISRPFFNAVTGMEDRELVPGNVTVNSSSSMQGASASLLCFPCWEGGCCDPCSVPTGYTYGMVSGFGWFRLNESIGMVENLPFSLPIPGGGVTTYEGVLSDEFRTTNDFYGPQLGVRGEWFEGKWFVNGTAQVALGVMHQTVNINGSTVYTSPPPPAGPFPGGFLAQPTNIGSYSRNVFGVVPQLNLNAGRQVTQNLRLFVGYSFMYFNSVVRPGDQIDPVLNLSQIPGPTGPGSLVGPARPAFEWRDTGMWVQGINVGAQWAF